MANNAQQLGVALAAAAQAWHRALAHYAPLGQAQAANLAATAYRVTLAATLAKQARAAGQVAHG
jgi:hypothetical protein